MILNENRLLADDSHEISFLIFFFKLGKMLPNLSSAAVVIGASRVKLSFFIVYFRNGGVALQELQHWLGVVNSIWPGLVTHKGCLSEMVKLSLIWSLTNPIDRYISTSIWC